MHGHPRPEGTATYHISPANFALHVIHKSKEVPADFAHLQKRQLAEQVAKQVLSNLFQGLQPALGTHAGQSFELLL